MNASPEQRRAAWILAGAFLLSVLIHLAFLSELRNYREPRAAEEQAIQQVTLTTVVHLHTPPPTTPAPTPTPTPPLTPPPPPSPTPPPPETPPPLTPPPATPQPQTPAPTTPRPVVHPQAAPKAAHLHLNVPKTTTQAVHASTEAHADTAAGIQNGTVGGMGTVGGTTGTGTGTRGTGTAVAPAATEEPAASCAHPNRVAGVDDPVEPEAPEGTEGISGIVRIQVTLTADGQIVDVKVAQTSGNALLDRAALDASRRSKFHSARKNCVDVPGIYLYRVEFAGQ